MSDSEDDEFILAERDQGGTKRTKDATDLLVDQALQEEQARKKAKKGGRPEPGVKKPKEGKTLAEIEEEEGGPIKESLVGMAQTKRAQNRKAEGKEALDSTEVPTDVQKYEEEKQVDEEDGIKFTGFNLEEERETGFFDEEGNYVDKVDPTDKDMWLTSEDAKVVSDEVRARIEAQRQAEAQAEADARRAAPLTDRQIAAMKMELAKHMQPGETLTRALKRHAGGSAAQQQRALGKRDKQRLQQQQQQQQQEGKAAAEGNGETASGPGGDTSVFARMTEIADQLLNEGEVDIYTETKEAFERFGAMWLPKKPAAATAAPAAAAAATAGAAAGEDEDMFADEDDAAAAGQVGQPGGAPAAAAAAAAKQEQAGGKGEPAQPAAAGQAQAAVQQGAGAAPEDGVDYASWPVKELKRFLQERGVDTASFTEKGDMVAKVKELAAAGPVMATSAAAPAYPVPLGYAYDPSSGYYHNAEVGMYYDASSGWYFRDGHWFTLDAAGNFVPHTG